MCNGKTGHGFLREHPYRIAAFLVVMGGTVVWTLLVPRHYDTGLYHAQAIRWIEEYGIVPGLGNLHMRLAYNSAFMSLQALFSLRWLGGESLHTLNGFFCLFFLGYAIMTIRIQKEQGCEISDLLKCAMVAYIVLNRDLISSPGTDLWTMMLVLYICIKWCEFVEMRQESDVPWSFICLAGIYAVTVKLSAALIVLLVIYPLYLLIRAKNIKRICGNIVAAALILLPFLIRNVIISGYLVYPYAGIDLFHVDWKMRKDELEHDSLLIKVFGRGFGNAQEEYDDSVFHWIPHWFHAQETRYQVLIAAGTICFIILAVELIRYVKTKQIRESVL